MRKITAGFLCFLTIIKVIQAGQYVYEFGVNRGDVFYTANGQISLTWVTEVNLPIPDNISMTYIKIVVDALSSPKVDYDNKLRKVNITYSWSQIPLSSYEIEVKGEAVPF